MHVSRILKYIIIFNLILTVNISINAEVFRFKFNKGSKQKIIAKFLGEQYQNGQLAAKYLQTYKTIRLVKDIEKEIGIIEDTHYYYNQNTYYNNQVFQIEDISTSNYKKDISGNIKVNENIA